jgi:hypothetical protein
MTTTHEQLVAEEMAALPADMKYSQGDASNEKEFADRLAAERLAASQAQEKEFADRLAAERAFHESTKVNPFYGAAAGAGLGLVGGEARDFFDRGLANVARQAAEHAPKPHSIDTYGETQVRPGQIAPKVQRSIVTSEQFQDYLKKHVTPAAIAATDISPGTLMTLPPEGSGNVLMRPANLHPPTKTTAPRPPSATGAFIRGGMSLPAASPISRTLGGAGAGYELVDAYNRAREGDFAGAAKSGLGAAGSALFTKKGILPKAIGAGMLGAAEAMKRPEAVTPLLKHFNDAAAERKAAGGSVQHFDKGGAAKQLIGRGVNTLMPAIKTLAEKFKYDPMKVGRAYPDRLPGVLEWDPKKNKEFMAKQLSPEALAVQKARRAAQTQIDAGNYTPFFDVSKRDYVDPTNYPLAGKTLTTVVPKTKASIDKYEALANNPESLDRLRAAYKAGSDKPLAKDWYAMKQLEDEFVKELGPEEGRRQFKARFADSMAATTGGADPKSNLMMATFANFQNAAGKDIPTRGYDLPFPIGGRFAGGNMRQAIALESLGDIPVTNPKRHNFSADFLGHRDRPTIDEQMSGLWKKGMKTPAGPSYGTYEAALNKLAAEAGVHPVNFQDVAWAGAKNYAGKPMMSEINEMIERTHQITGLPKAEVLKGFIRADRPMYSAAPIGAGGLGALSAEDEVPE